jgi:hypothetical protein
VIATKEKRRRVQGACIVALVLGFHLIVLWLLLASSRVVTRQTDSGGFEIVLIARPPTTPQPPALPAAKSSGHAAQPAPAQPLASAGAVPPQPAPPGEQNNAIHAPINWAAELESTARNATADETGRTPKDFGFPHVPSAPAKVPQFGWDYVATHRVESIPEGGLLVHLNDNCVLVLFPLPFAGCGIGKKPANGELFKNMGDTSTQSESASTSP